mmetsp:Transcript_56718/g.133136  ORF Transcript_56718/g.133136 Transcript_56718/m.133136 type:complete len:81 (+) Transcript_56718:390-632(+)
MVLEEQGVLFSVMAAWERNALAQACVVAEVIYGNSLIFVCWASSPCSKIFGVVLAAHIALESSSCLMTGAWVAVASEALH